MERIHYVEQASPDLATDAYPSAWGTSSEVVTVPGSAYQQGYLLFPYQQFIPLSQERPDRWLVSSRFGRAGGPWLSMPEGAYTFSLQRGGVWTEFALQMGAGTMPLPLLALNYAQLQALDPGAAITVAWEMPDDADPADRIEAILYVLAADGGFDLVDESTWEHGKAVRLDAGSMSIAAGHTQPGRRYLLELRRLAVIDELAGFVPEQPLARALTGNMSATSIGLRLSDDPLPEPTLRWAYTAAMAWETSGPHFLTPRPQATLDLEFEALFVVDDALPAPAAQVLFLDGPDGTFQHTPARYAVRLPEGLAYAAQTPAFALPPAGNYSVRYKEATHVFAKVMPPDGTDAPLVVPTVQLAPAAAAEAADSRMLSGMTWRYAGMIDRPQAPDPASIRSLSLAMYGEGGAYLGGVPEIDPQERELNLEAMAIPWHEVRRMRMVAGAVDGHLYRSDYYIGHHPSPLQVYLGGGAFSAGWIASPWFGWARDVAYPWLYAQDRGWLWAAGEGDGKVWFFDPEIGWWHSGPDLYPYLYACAMGHWLYVHWTGAGHARPYYYDLAEGRWLP